MAEYKNEQELKEAIERHVEGTVDNEKLILCGIEYPFSPTPEEFERLVTRATLDPPLNGDKEMFKFDDEHRLLEARAPALAAPGSMVERIRPYGDADRVSHIGNEGGGMYPSRDDPLFHPGDGPQGGRRPRGFPPGFGARWDDPSPFGQGPGGFGNGDSNGFI